MSDMPDPEVSRLPRSWHPQPGESIAGFVSERHSRPSDYTEDDVEVLVIDQLDTGVSIWCSTRQLRDMVAEHDPQPGDFLELRYDGQEWVRHVNAYRKNYTYRITKAS